MFFAIAINKRTQQMHVSAGVHNAANSRPYECKTAKQAAKRVAEIDKHSFEHYGVVQEFESLAAADAHCAMLNKA